MQNLETLDTAFIQFYEGATKMMLLLRQIHHIRIKLIQNKKTLFHRHVLLV